MKDEPLITKGEAAALVKRMEESDGIDPQTHLMKNIVRILDEVHNVAEPETASQVEVEEFFETLRSEWS